MTEPAVKSPCIAVCVLDADDICEGCFRTADEITDWFMADNDTKRRILADCATRRRSRERVRLD